MINKKIIQQQQQQQQSSLGCVGIQCENKSEWERRVPLSPDDIQLLLNKNPSMKFIVQPCKIRVFTDKQYFDAGAFIQEDLSKCNLILGVREVAARHLLQNKMYMFFSHTIKGQRHNIALIEAMLAKNISLFDYEAIQLPNGKRAVHFGNIAGNAGCIDFLVGLGHYFLKNNYGTPFLNLSLAYKYFDKQDAEDLIIQLSERIIFQGLPTKFCPLIFAVIGNGNTSQGVIEILKLLPIKIVDPDELQLICQSSSPDHAKFIYVAIFDIKHIVAKLNDEPMQSKDIDDYKNCPEKYKPIFHSQYLPYISCIFNCIYWDSGYPRLITNTQLKDLTEQGNCRLIAVCDIACDLEGSIEFVRKYTNMDNHFFVYYPTTGLIEEKIEKNCQGIMYMAVDSLASEMSFDASIQFSRSISKYIEQLAFLDNNVSEKQLMEKLPNNLKKALVYHKGTFSDRFHYISHLIKGYSDSSQNQKKVHTICLHGHIFDSKGIFEIIKFLQDQNVQFKCRKWNIGVKDEDQSRMTLDFYTDETEQQNRIMDFVAAISKSRKLSFEIQFEAKQEDYLQ